MGLCNSNNINVCDQIGRKKAPPNRTNLTIGRTLMAADKPYDKIRALLSKTVANGCTEAEAMAALALPRFNWSVLGAERTSAGRRDRLPQSQ
jgi:hypothetical protein